MQQASPRSHADEVRVRPLGMMARTMSNEPDQPTTSIPTTVLHLQEGLHFVARTPSGFEVQLDSRTEAGGPPAGPSPMELQLVALGACGAMDTLSILRKMRQDVTAYEVHLTQTRAAEHPRVFRTIRIMHRLRGHALAEANVRRAIGLTMVRYCPVYAMLHPTVDMSERFEIIDEATGVAREGDVTAADGEGTRPAQE